MRYALGLAAIVATGLFFACGGDQEFTGGVQVTEQDSAGVSLVTIAGQVSDLPEWSLSTEPVTEISGDAPPFLGRVGEVEILADGGVLIEDNQTDELRLFDQSGLVVRLFGGRGDGPGEFQNLTELSMTPGDTAVAYDRRLYRISVFEPGGDLVTTIAVGRERAGQGSLTLDAWALDSEHLILHSMAEGDLDFPEGPAFRDQRDAVVHSIDTNGKDRVSPVRFTGGYSIRGSFGDISAIWTNRPFVSANANQVLHGSGIEYELLLRTPDLELVRVVLWSGWIEPLAASTVEAVREAFESGMEELRAARPDVAKQLTEALFDPDLLPEVTPALGTAFLDEQGRMWVSRFGMRSQQWSQEDSWHVLDPRGHPLARLRLPPQSRLAAVRGDRVALISHDDLDVEHVRVYQIVVRQK